MRKLLISAAITALFTLPAFAQPGGHDDHPHGGGGEGDLGAAGKAVWRDGGVGGDLRPIVGDEHDAVRAPPVAEHARGDGDAHGRGQCERGYE